MWCRLKSWAGSRAIQTGLAVGARQNAGPEGTKPATSANMRLLRLLRDLRTGSILRDIVNFPSELSRRRSGTFAEVARLVPPQIRTSLSVGARQNAELLAETVLLLLLLLLSLLSLYYYYHYYNNYYNYFCNIFIIYM